MRVRHYATAAFIALIPTAATAAARTSLRGSPASMQRQHDVALQEELTFSRTPDAVLAEVAAGTLTELPGNSDYRVAGVSFAYAVPEVRLLVERLAAQYHEACGEKLVVTSLTRPKARQPRNAHELSVHPAGMAVDLRISKKAFCRSWLEGTLLSLERAQVLDITRERTPPHYHVAVFPTPYREYVARLAPAKPEPAAPEPRAQPPVKHAAIVNPPVQKPSSLMWVLLGLFSLMPTAVVSLALSRPALHANRPVASSPFNAPRRRKTTSA